MSGSKRGVISKLVRDIPKETGQFTTAIVQFEGRGLETRGKGGISQGKGAIVFIMYFMNEHLATNFPVGETSLFRHATVIATAAAISRLAWPPP